LNIQGCNLPRPRRFSLSGEWGERRERDASFIVFRDRRVDPDSIFGRGRKARCSLMDVWSRVHPSTLALRGRLRCSLMVCAWKGVVTMPG
jgi:hypothetical protein